VETKTCRKCRLPWPLKSFTEYKPGQRRATCLSCRKQQDITQNPERVKKERSKATSRVSDQRRNGQKVGQWILVDSRRSDRRRGLNNDLTRDFIDAEIAKGCAYCGESSLRMTLDRKDNAIGHVVSNVVPACIRCNYARGAMPFEAWLCLASGMRLAREKGLFGYWTGRCR